MIGSVAEPIGGSAATFTKISRDGSRQLAYRRRREWRAARGAIGD
jgi:hypothetical protein